MMITRTEATVALLSTGQAGDPAWFESCIQQVLVVIDDLL